MNMQKNKNSMTGILAITLDRLIMVADICGPPDQFPLQRLSIPTHLDS
jgi:hypothetical protein